MNKCFGVLCLLSVFVFCGAVSTTTKKDGLEVASIHIVRPPIRCPEGMKPDANGNCRKVWSRSLNRCYEGEVLDANGWCKPVNPKGFDSFNFLKFQESLDLEVEGLFTTSGNLRTRKKIQTYLTRGDVCTLRNWGFEFVVECAAALKIFLQNLPQPLIPLRIQQLVIADNSGVPEKTIANDALGLLKEEVNGRHKELLLEVFTFLKEAAVKANTSELTGCNLPLKLLPVFFDIGSNDPQKFRDIATVFNEIIMEAPEHLKGTCGKISSGELKIFERFLSQDIGVPNMTAPPNRRNQPTGENLEWRIPVPRVPHSRMHPWLGRVEHSTSA